MSGGYDDVVRQHRRCSMLRFLADITGNEANDSLLRDVLDQHGLACSRDAVRVEIAWLEEQGLVTVVDIAGIKIATATERGIDAGLGRAIVPGVKRPTRH
jgi:repressor of nif and glnA expression